MFKKEMIFGFRKNKAIKTLCGAVIAISLASLGSAVSADEVSGSQTNQVTTTTMTTTELNNQPTTEETPTTPVAATETSAAPVSEVTTPATSEVTSTPSVETTQPVVETPVARATVETQPTSQVIPEVVNTSVDTQTNATATPTAQAPTTVTQNSSRLNITYNDVVAPNDKLMFAVWTENKAQDDLRWYTAYNNQISVDLTQNHKAYGLYNIHTYISTNGQMIGKNAQQYTVKTNVPNVAVTKVSDLGYQVVVSNVSNDITDIKLPIWTENQSQDDLRWYGTSKNPDGSYSALVSISNHKYETGLYNIHVYGISAITNGMKGLKTSRFDFDNLSGTTAPSTGNTTNPDTTPTTPTPTQVKVTTTLSVAKGAFINVNVQNVPSNIREVVIPTWTDKNNQDDIIWYSATLSGTTATCTLSIANHNYDTGLYNVHVYGKTYDGALVGLTADQVTVPTVQVKTTVVNKGGNNYEVTVSDVPFYITKIDTPIWSTRDNQDDIRWYQTTKNTDGTYTTPFNLANHENNIGEYKVHVYGTNLAGQFRGLAGGTKYIVSDLEVAPAKYVTGQRVEIQPYAVYDTMGTNISSKREWIGVISTVAKNTDNAIGGWKYGVTFTNGSQQQNIIERDLKYVYDVQLSSNTTKEQNNIILQQAMNYANANPNVTLYLPQGDYVIGSNIQESDLGKVSGNEYMILASNTKLRGNDLGTNLVVDGTMLWFGLPTGTRGIDGVHDLVIDNINVRAKDMIKGDYFMIMLNHGNNITVKNSSFTMVQRKSRHVFDLGAVQNITIKNNKFVGYAPELTNYTSIPSGADLHDFYAEVIQIDASNSNGGWDASMIKNIAYNAYMNYNSTTSLLSSNVAILSNQFLPYTVNGKILAYSSTVGQHSSQVGNVFIKNNYMERALSTRFNRSEWYMQPIHYINAVGYGADISGNVIV